MMKRGQLYDVIRWIKNLKQHYMATLIYCDNTILIIWSNACKTYNQYNPYRQGPIL